MIERYMFCFFGRWRNGDEDGAERVAALNKRCGVGLTWVNLEKKEKKNLIFKINKWEMKN